MLRAVLAAMLLALPTPSAPPAPIVHAAATLPIEGVQGSDKTLYFTLEGVTLYRGATVRVNEADPAGACGGHLPCYTTIGGALNAVMVNGNVDVYAATYTEDISLTSGATLNLLGATTLNGGLTIGSGTTVNSTSGNFSITGNWANNGAFNSNAGRVFAEQKPMQVTPGLSC